MNPPKIFISATTGDLGSARQIAKEAQLTINCHPVEQSSGAPIVGRVCFAPKACIGE